MVICAAYGCASTSGRDKIEFFKFPKDDKFRKIWCERLGRGQVGNRLKAFVPTKHSRLCARHFTEDQFATKSLGFLRSIGFQHKMKAALKRHAVPSVFSDVRSSTRPERKSADARRKKLIASITSCQEAEHPPQNPPQWEDEVYFATPLLSSVITTTTSITPTITTTSVGSTTTVTTSSSETLTWFADICLASSKPTVSSYSVQTQTPYNLVGRCNVSSQCGPSMVDAETQTESTYTLEIPACTPVDISLNESLRREDSRDIEWTPASDTESECGGSASSFANEAQEEKFIVYRSCLEELLKRCRVCGLECLISSSVIGTCVIYKRTCVECGTATDWSSQPFSSSMPFGNLVLCAAIMFSGASPLQTLRMMQFCKIASVSKTTYLKIQSSYLVPSVRSVWQQRQAIYVNAIQSSGRQLRLAGDGRCCSPGHTAKFGAYIMKDLEKNIILDIQLVQSNEVPNSYGMEKEGLSRSLAFMLNENNLPVSHLVTDRHSAIKKYMRDHHPNIQHWFDVWHVAKGVHKKLLTAGKKKGCEKVAAWARSVSNHLYWCAASSEGDGRLLKDKWVSILNHVANIHEGHGAMFPRCAHAEIQEQRDWMVKGRKPHAELEKVIASPYLLRDIEKLSPAEQTSSLEAFHKVICAFAPKSVHYFHAQMEARLYLAALHFNENQSRPQKYNKRGDLQCLEGTIRTRNLPSPRVGSDK